MQNTLSFREEEDEVVIIEIRGKLSPESNSAALRALLRELEDAGYRCIILDMSRLTYIGSAVVDDLFAACEGFAHRGGAVKLFGVPKHAASVLHASRMDSVFELHENEREAIGSFCMPGTGVGGEILCLRLPSEVYMG